MTEPTDDELFEPTDPDAGRAMPTDPNDVALDADCMVPGYWPDLQPTDTPTAPDVWRRLFELAQLKEGWDSCGAYPMQSGIRERAAALLGHLIQEPLIGLTPSGGVHLAWGLDDVIIELEPDGTVTALIEDRGLAGWSASGILRDARTLRAQLDAAMAERRYMSQQLQASVGRECNALCNDIEQDRDELERELATLRAQLDASMDGERKPRRDDDVATWLKQQRDREDQTGGSHDRARWDALDAALGDYRLHADTGTPLLEHACEGSYCCADPAEEECPGPVPGHGCDDCRSDNELHPERFQ